MAGIPVICSDKCGVAGVVAESGVGGVFNYPHKRDLTAKLSGMLKAGPLSVPERTSLAKWANCLNGDSGARYLSRILDYQLGAEERPFPPWETQLS